MPIFIKIALNNGGKKGVGMSLGVYFPKIIHSPKIIRMEFNQIHKDCIVVGVFNEEYKKCQQASCGKNFWGNSKGGAYGKGLGRTKNDKYKPARTGFLGQMAYCKVFGDPIDFSYKKGGDKYDSIIGREYKVDIKCAMENRGKGLIYHTNEWGNRIPLNKDIYVFGYIHLEDRLNNKAEVVLTGYTLKKDIENNALVCQGVRGRGHKNYEIYFENLRPIKQLLDWKKKEYGTYEGDI